MHRCMPQSSLLPHMIGRSVARTAGLRRCFPHNRGANHSAFCTNQGQDGALRQGLSRRRAGVAGVHKRDSAAAAALAERRQRVYYVAPGSGLMAVPQGRGYGDRSGNARSALQAGRAADSRGARPFPGVDRARGCPDVADHRICQLGRTGAVARRSSDPIDQQWLRDSDWNLRILRGAARRRPLPRGAI